MEVMGEGARPHLGICKTSTATASVPSLTKPAKTRTHDRLANTESAVDQPSASILRCNAPHNSPALRNPSSLGQLVGVALAALVDAIRGAAPGTAKAHADPYAARRTKHCRLFLGVLVHEQLELVHLKRTAHPGPPALKCPLRDGKSVLDPRRRPAPSSEAHQHGFQFLKRLAVLDVTPMFPGSLAMLKRQPPRSKGRHPRAPTPLLQGHMRHVLVLRPECFKGNSKEPREDTEAFLGRPRIDKIALEAEGPKVGKHLKVRELGPHSLQSQFAPLPHPDTAALLSEKAKPPTTNHQQRTTAQL